MSCSESSRTPPKVRLVTASPTMVILREASSSSSAACSATFTRCVTRGRLNVLPEAGIGRLVKAVPHRAAGVGEFGDRPEDRHRQDPGVVPGGLAGDGAGQQFDRFGVAALGTDVQRQPFADGQLDRRGGAGGWARVTSWVEGATRASTLAAASIDCCLAASASMSGRICSARLYNASTSADSLSVRSRFAVCGLLLDRVDAVADFGVLTPEGVESHGHGSTTLWDLT